jgi:tetratricopeptide (TPR) repeat protein
MRFFASLLTVSLSLVTLPAGAQDKPRPQPDPAPAARQAPRPSTLDELFDRLSKAESEREAQGIAALIDRRFSRSGSDTADLLLSRATEAFKEKNYPLAIELLDRILVLQPNWAEAWYRRATLFYQLDDPAGAMADLYQALKLEPRHFSAWTGLGHILMSSEDKPRALEAFRRALKINPQVEMLQTMVMRLDREVAGQDL